MKRTIPIILTALGGFVLIVSFFIPYTEGWGEVAAIWFDILAAIAFILGGGNLLKMHLKKVSDQGAGWAYSVITLVAFLVTLFVGLGKWGAPPAPNQEFYGQRFASLPLKSFPEMYSVEGVIPKKANGEPLPSSVQRQIQEKGGLVYFTGWMTGDQKKELLAYKEELEWQCTVERLFNEAQPPGDLKVKVVYHADRQMLGFRGHMTDADRSQLFGLGDKEPWVNAVESLYESTSGSVEVEAEADNVPSGFDAQRAEKVSKFLTFDGETNTLAIKGPMSTKQRDDLARQFPIALPRSTSSRSELIEELKKHGDVTEEMEAVINKVLDTSWTLDMLRRTLDAAGKAQVKPKTACEMFEEREAGATDIKPTKKVGTDQLLEMAQVDIVTRFIETGDGSVAAIEKLTDDLAGAGPFNDNQQDALKEFFEKSPTEGERKKEIAVALRKSGALSNEQKDFLLGEYRKQVAWRAKVGDLFVKAHVVKYPWSGEYRAQGGPFWWLYEYAFKPLTATMFAMLAFYVASAAFRAFRAKNTEAILLLGTAFIILLGRTFAGVWLTSFLPDTGLLSYLRVENLTVTIMTVFNTAGNRAIMIGIALGIASTSLKVLLGIDRSYLGSGED